MTTGFDSFNRWMQGVSDRVVKDYSKQAAAAAAEEIQIEAKLRAPVSDAPHYFQIEGRKYGPFNPGNLRDSIYRVYSKDRSVPELGIHAYHVSWNFKKAPYGFMVEFGDSKHGAKAFLSPAYEAKKAAAYAKAAEVFRKNMQ